MKPSIKLRMPARAWTIISAILLVSFFACKKDKNDDKSDEVPPVKSTPRKVWYQVKGSNFSLNYIDSNGVFQKDKVYSDEFNYQFTRGSGSGIGISINKVDGADSIYAWNIFIDGKLTANAFSEGGAYFYIPYY